MADPKSGQSTNAFLSGSAALNVPHNGNFALYFANKISKLQEQNNAIAPALVLSGIFRGCSVHVKGNTSPSIAEIRRLVTAHGGEFHAYQLPSTTHYICDSFAATKVNYLRKTKVHHVTASWLTDSVASGKRLSERLYVPPELQTDTHSKAVTSFFRETQSEQRVASSASAEATESVVAARPSGGEEGAARGGHNTSDDPNFLRNFFANSRLHFIGSWRNRLTRFAKAMMLKHNKLVDVPHAERRVVLHVDMDAFFVSALLRSKPHLQRMPVAVAHGSSDGCEVSSCNYPARARGVTNGMFMGAARSLCPELVVLGYDFALYEELSIAVYEVFYGTSEALVVQPVSVDEAYLELPATADGMAVARRIRERVFEQTRCPCSAGVGPNMLLAKIATKRAKPDGQFEISADNLEDVLGDMRVTDLPGVGWRRAQALAERSVRTVADLRALSKDTLKGLVGAGLGQTLFETCRGVDGKALRPVPLRSSVSVEVNWGLRFDDQGKAEAFVGELAHECSRRLEEALVRGGRSVTMKILKRKLNAPAPSKFMGHGQVDALSKSMTGQRALGTREELEGALLPLFRRLTSGMDVTELRGMGVQVDRLQELGPAPVSTTTSAARVQETAGDESDFDEWDISDEKVRAVKAAVPLPSAVEDAGEGLSLSELDFLRGLPPELVDEQVALLRGLKEGRARAVVPKRHAQDHRKSPSKAKRAPLKKRGRRDGREVASLFDSVRTGGASSSSLTRSVDGPAPLAEAAYSLHACSEMAETGAAAPAMSSRELSLLLASWAARCDGAPSDEEVSVLIDYGDSLVQSHCLAEALVFIRALRRHGCSARWAEVVEAAVQAASERMFQFKLKC